MSLAQARRVHFVGVGGAGMSAVAKVLLEQGVAVTGSDLKRSRAGDMLAAMGADVQIGHRAEAVDGADAVVISSAIPESNEELIRARDLGIPVLLRGEALADLLMDRRSIVIAGTHGKTTTTSMIVTILRAADVDPTYLVGAGLNDVGTNARFGHGDIVVAESDESDGSFLLLGPHIAVITNVEADHLDHWGSLDAIREAFSRFIANVDPAGTVVAPADDDHVIAAAARARRRVVTFGDDGDVVAENLDLRGSESTFDLVAEGRRTEVALAVPGGHNVSNALAAAAACLRVGVALAQVGEGLRRFRGVERRFQIRGEVGGVTIIDDYAHHPTEVRAVLAAARPGPWSRVVAVFQPHRYSRTVALGAEFGGSFADADRVVVTDVYGAGEAPIPGVSGKVVADAVCRSLPGRPVAYLPHREELVSYLEATAREGDALLTLGAGDVHVVGEELLARMRRAA